MAKKVKIIVGLGFVLCAILLFDGFIPESIALWSRIAHKSRQVLVGYEIQAPHGWGISEHRDSLNFYKERGHFRTYLFGPSEQLIGFYVVPPRKRPVDYQDAISSLVRVQERIRKISERSLAGKRIVCVQSSLPEKPDIQNVMCVPDGSMDGISITYTGDAEHIPEFFAILDNVKKTN